MNTPSRQPAHSPEGEAGSQPTSRRQRQRQVTLGDITLAAQQQLTEHGVRGFSLRAVAREAGLAPSAIYRYYDSQTALVSAVAVTAYQQVAQALRAAVEQSAGEPTRGRLAATFAAYRTWALSHPGEFELLFGTDQSLLRADAPASPAPSELHRLFEVPLTVLLEGTRSGDVGPLADTSPSPSALTAATVALVEELEARTGLEVTATHVVAVGVAWLRVHGLVGLELYGHLGAFVEDAEACFRNQLDVVLDSLGV